MANCSAPLTGLLPLTDLGAATYLGFQGGLYPNGMNRPPDAHYGAGRRLARQIADIKAAGQPVAFAGLGFSGALRTWTSFTDLHAAHPHTDKAVKLVNACKAGANADILMDPTKPYWTSHVPAALAAASVAAQDVRVVWIQTGMPPPAGAFPGHAQALQSMVAAIATNVKVQFPNCLIAYLTSGHYHGYADTPNLEPYGTYEQGFAIKWAIEQQIAGDTALKFHGAGTVAPWLAWAGYPWCDGASQRGDGLTMVCPDDFASDGQHPNQTGAAKLGAVLFNDLLDDWTAKEWMLNLPSGGGSGTPPPPTQTAG